MDRLLSILAVIGVCVLAVVRVLVPAVTADTLPVTPVLLPLVQAESSNARLSSLLSTPMLLPTSAELSTPAPTDTPRPATPTATPTILTSTPVAYTDYGQHLLRRWRSQLARMAQRDALSESSNSATVAFIGDSWVNNGFISQPLTAWLQSEYGDAGAGYASASFLQAWPSPKVGRWRSGTWTDTQMPDGLGIDLAHSISSDAETPAQLNVSAEVNAFVLHYLQRPGGGQFRYQIDGGPWVDIDTAAPGTAYATEPVTGLDGHRHTLTTQITNGGADGVTLMGVDCQKSAGGVRVHKLGRGGAAAADYSATNGAIWQAGLSVLAPDLVIILLGTNDDARDVEPGLFREQMAALVASVRQILPHSDVLLLGPAANGMAPGAFTIPDYVRQLQSVAIDNGTAYLDLYSYIGDYSEAEALGLYLNPSHLNQVGGQVAADLLISRLLRVR